MMHACLVSHVQLFVTSRTVAHQAPLSMGISRQKYWSGLPFPTLGHLPDPGVKPMSFVSPVLAGGFFTTEPPGKPQEGKSSSVTTKPKVGWASESLWEKVTELKGFQDQFTDEETRLREEVPCRKSQANITHSLTNAYQAPTVCQPQH